MLRIQSALMLSRRGLLVFALLAPGLLPAAVMAAAPGTDAGTVFRDCSDCPEMVVVPPGNFQMGSLATETERDKDEGPVREVAIAYAFAIGRYEVTRAQFTAFLEDSGHNPSASAKCHYPNPSLGHQSDDDDDIDWRNPGFPQGDDHPVVCVDWNDAKAYAAWLSRKTGQTYRLLSEAEWEYAARAGSQAARPWGDSAREACVFANVGDLARDRGLSRGPAQKWMGGHDCDDGYAFTAPVGSFESNKFGLYDMIGNVWEWTEDCWNESYAGAPLDGSPWLAGDCSRRVDRGASWSAIPRHARSANRDRSTGVLPRRLIGFRVARSL